VLPVRSYVTSQLLHALPPPLPPPLELVVLPPVPLLELPPVPLLDVPPLPPVLPLVLVDDEVLDPVEESSPSSPQAKAATAVTNMAGNARYLLARLFMSGTIAQ